MEASPTTPWPTPSAELGTVGRSPVVRASIRSKLASDVIEDFRLRSSCGRMDARANLGLVESGKRTPSASGGLRDDLRLHLPRLPKGRTTLALSHAPSQTPASAPIEALTSSNGMVETSLEAVDIWGARCGKSARRVLLGEASSRSHAGSVRALT